MRKFVQWLGCLAAFLVCAQDGGGAYSVTRPIAGSNYIPTSNVYTEGARNANSNVIVKLEIISNNQVNIGAESETMLGNMYLTTWSKNFPAPQATWTVSDEWNADLYSCDSSGGNQVFQAGVRYHVRAP